MKRKAEFLECQFEATPEAAFLLEYQKNVLLTLLRDGFLTQEQFDECVRRLEHQKK